MGIVRIEAEGKVDKGLAVALGGDGADGNGHGSIGSGQEYRAMS